MKTSIISGYVRLANSKGWTTEWQAAKIAWKVTLNKIEVDILTKHEFKPGKSVDRWQFLLNKDQLLYEGLFETSILVYPGDTVSFNSSGFILPNGWIYAYV